jgi:hypothetical protein
MDELKIFMAGPLGRKIGNLQISRRKIELR